MDISKYIGLYLVKNGYCSLPSLGTLQLEKVGAKRFDATTIDPAKYIINFSAVGSIDDKFPHFIAMNENISTNNATNAISVFGKEVKEEVAAYRPYVLSGLGRFINNNGKIDFQQQSDFDFSEFAVALPEPVAPIVDNTRVAQTEKDMASNLDFKTVMNNPQKEASFNFAKVLLPIGLLTVIAVGGYFGYDYLKKSQSSNPIVPTTDTIVQVAIPIIDTAIKDSNATILDANATKATGDSTNPAAPIANGSSIKVAILTYNTQSAADAKAKKLANFNPNNITSVNKLDSATYQVVITLPNTDKPVAMVVDSLRKFFNPSEKQGKVEVVK